MLVLYFIHIFLILQSAYSEEVTTTKNDEDLDLDIFGTNNKTSTIKNVAKENITQRITQPSQTQQIERTLEPTNARNFSKPTPNFKPSPQLETYYEFNKFPVPPAFPEAKQFPVQEPNFLEENKQFGWSNQNQDFNKQNNYPWLENSNIVTTSETPWVSRVKFPTPQTQNRPYGFEINEKPRQYGPTGYSSVKNEGFNFNKPVPVAEKPGKSYLPSVFGGGTKQPSSVNSVGSLWDKFSSGMGFGKQRPQKPNWDYNLLEKPEPEGHFVHKTTDFGVGESYGENPWKKIIKLLTAFIPIGLLISALTPTVITVTSVNETIRTRSRAEDSQQEIARRLVSSLSYFTKLNDKGCEDRILCELLLSASQSKNPEHHVTNLLNNLSEQEKDVKSKAANLKKIFAAVKRQNCDPIVCTNIKKPT